MFKSQTLEANLLPRANKDVFFRATCSPCKQISFLIKGCFLKTDFRKMAVRIINEIISEARIILDRLDDAFEAIIRDEKFLDGWFDARKIKGRSRRKNNGNGNGPDDATTEDE